MKAKCHHALLGRECKSVNTFSFSFFHPFLVKRQLTTESILLSSEVVISSPFDLTIGHFKHNMFPPVVPSLEELFVPCSEQLLGQKVRVFIIDILL